MGMQHQDQDAPTTAIVHQTPTMTACQQPTQTPAPDNGEKPSVPIHQRLYNFYLTNQFATHLLVAIALAKAYPPLGARYLAPDITASWLAVAIIFFISGLGLEVNQLVKAVARVKFNVVIQVFNFIFISAVVYAICLGILALDILDEALTDGLIICGCLPMAINAIIVLSIATGADEAAAIFNATLSNIVGIFLSPVLMLLYLGTKGEVAMGEVFWKLVLRVVVPLLTGQALQKIIPSIKAFFVKHKYYFKKTSEYCLVYIVYAVFCKTFYKRQTTVSLGSIFLMLFVIFILCVFFMVTSWYFFKVAFPNDPKLRVVGFVGGSQKTIAMGIPLIASIYEGNPNEGLYALPILIWHPLMLFLVSLFIPHLTEFIKTEQARIEKTNKKNNTSINSSDTDSDDINAARGNIALSTTSHAPSTASHAPSTTSAASYDLESQIVKLGGETYITTSFVNVESRKTHTPAVSLTEDDVKLIERVLSDVDQPQQKK